MEKKFWIALGSLAAVAMLAVIALCVFKGGCTEMLNCGEKQVPMKCHWAFIAARTVAVGGIVMAVIAIFAKGKEGRIVASVGVLVAALTILFVVSSFGIGVCKSPEMICNQTAPMVNAASAIAAVISLAMIFKADPDVKPKMQL